MNGMTKSVAEQTSFKVYKLLNGSIIVLAMLTALEHEALTEWQATAIIFLTLTATAVAEAFSRWLAAEIAHRRQLSLGEAGALLRGSLIVVLPALVPAAAFAAVAAGWLSLGAGFAGACWLLVLVLFAAGVQACRLGGGSGVRSLLYGLIISAFGLGIVTLRLLAQ